MVIFVPHGDASDPTRSPAYYDSTFQYLANLGVPVLKGGEPLLNGATEVHLVHSGWGHSPAWDKPRLWFERAWNGALKALAAKFEKS